MMATGSSRPGMGMLPQQGAALSGTRVAMLTPGVRRTPKPLQLVSAAMEPPSRPSFSDSPRPSPGGGTGYQGRGSGGGYQGRGSSGGYQGRGGGGRGRSSGPSSGRGRDGPGRGGPGRGGPARGPGRGGPGRGPGGFQGRGRGDFQGRGRGDGGGRGRGRGRFNPRFQEPETIVPINEDIDFEEVRVIGIEREALGVMSLEEARTIAEEAEVDVLLITPDAQPPVVRLVEYSKFKYEMEKKEKDGKKKQRESRVDLKELKLRPGTGEHDYQVRLRQAKQFLSKGDKVKLTLQFRGREMEFRDQSAEMFDNFMNDLGHEGSVEAAPRMMGRTMSMIIAPKKIEP